MKKPIIKDLSKALYCVKGRLSQEQKDEVLNRMNFWADNICYAENDEAITKVIEELLPYSKRKNSLVSSLSFKNKDDDNFYLYEYKDKIITTVYPDKYTVDGFLGWKPHRRSSGLFIDTLFRIVLKELGIK